MFIFKIELPTENSTNWSWIFRPKGYVILHDYFHFDYQIDFLPFNPLFTLHISFETSFNNQPIHFLFAKIVVFRNIGLCSKFNPLVNLKQYLHRSSHYTSHSMLKENQLTTYNLSKPPWYQYHYGTLPAFITARTK